MKVVHSPSPSANPKKREKINLFENDDPEEVAALCQQSAQQESNKILLRIDARTQVLVAVSYTHLDVYKRQVLDTTNEIRWKSNFLT